MNPNIFSQNGELVIILIKKKKKGVLRSLRWTLLITYALIGFLPLLIFANMVFSTMGQYYVEERKKDLLSQANVISGHISISNYLFDETKKNSFDYFIEKTSKQNGYRIIVVDSSGVVVNDSNQTDIGKTYLVPEVIEALNSSDVARLQPNGTIYVAVSITDLQSQKVGAVFISALATDIETTIDGIKNQVYILLAAIFVVVGVLIIFLSQFYTQPLKNMIEVIKKMADGHLEQRIPTNNHTHNEITDLAMAFNNMAEKLEQVESTRQQFVSNVSHELKTPLSSIKVLSEAILLETDVSIETYQEFLKDINSEIDRMTDIINDLLTLVKLDQKEIPLSFQPASLNQLVEEIIKRLTPLAQKKNISLEYESNKDITAEIDEMKMSLALSNLVDNAIKYTQEGGSVKVIVDGDHQNAFFTVTDTGVGIAEEEIGKIFDRFYRVDKTRDRDTGGTGLGLAITHSTILMHNGSIKVTSKENEGTTFVVRIPLRQSL